MPQEQKVNLPVPRFPTPIVDGMDRLEHPVERIGNVPSCLKGPEWVPIDDARELERDLITLALRLYGEPLYTFSPEVVEVMVRLRPTIQTILRTPIHS